MKLKTLIPLLLLLLIGTTVITGCSKSAENYRNGIYWLEKEGNWQSASRAFQRALATDPDSWKIHSKLIETLAMGASPDSFIVQLKSTLSFFPDSARSPRIAEPGMKLLGDEAYNRLSGSFELQRIGTLLANDRDDKTLLSRGIMAACRAKDTLAMESYFNHSLDIWAGEPLSDSVLQEMRFFVGPSQVDWIVLDWRVKRNPNDTEAILAQIDAGVVLGDSAKVVRKLKNLARKNPAVLEENANWERYGTIAGVSPYSSSVFSRGWDGTYSLDGKEIIYLKNMGNQKYPDTYVYKRTANSGTETPLLKAAQQNLGSIAWPVFSPDKKWLYFYGSNDRNWTPGGAGRFTLYRAKAKFNSRARKVTSADLLITDPYFNDDGTILLVRKDLGSVRSSVEIIKINPDTGELTSVTRIGEPVTGATFNSTGDSLIFITDRGIFRRSINGGKMFVDLNWTGMSFPQLSPDDRWLKLINPSGQLILIDRNTERPYFLGTVDSPRISFGTSDILVSQFGDNWQRVVKVNAYKAKAIQKQFIKALGG